MLKGRSCSVCTWAIEQENQWISYCLTEYTRNERIMKWMSLQCELFESYSWVLLAVPSLKVARKENIFLQYHLPNIILTPYGSVILYFGHDGFPQETFHLSVHSRDTDNISYLCVVLTAGFMGIPTGMIPGWAHCQLFGEQKGNKNFLTCWRRDGWGGLKHLSSSSPAGKVWLHEEAVFHSASFLCSRQGLNPTREGTSGATSELKHYWGIAAQGTLLWQPVEATKSGQ